MSSSKPPLVENATRDLANLVKSIDRNHLFMRSDLKYRVGRSVDDRLARSYVLFAKLFDYFGARSGHIAEHAGNASLGYTLVHDRGGKSVWISRKCLLQNDAGHFPVARRRIFAV